MAEKLFLVTHRQLTVAQQAVQSMHAYGRFEELHPGVYRDWYNKSNTLAFLAVESREALGALLDKALERAVHVAPFYEPDPSSIGVTITDSPEGTLTAIALGPSAKGLTRDIPKALDDDPEKRQPGHYDR